MLLTMAAAAAAEEVLPPGLLEFLGGMVEIDGELIDPLTLQTGADQMPATTADPVMLPETETETEMLEGGGEHPCGNQ